MDRKILDNVRNTAKLALVFLGMLMLFGVQAAPADKAIPGGPGSGEEDPTNWPLFYRTANAWRYSPLAQINKKNVKNLKVAWIHQPGDITQGLPVTPIVIDGVIYYVSAWNKVQAVDAVTGKEKWNFQPELDPATLEAAMPGYSRGVTVGLGKVFLATLDGRMVALDKNSGKQLWVTQVLPPLRECHCYFNAPPTLAGEMLVLGHSGGGYKPKMGHIFGVDANSGKMAWKLETLRDDPASWPGDSRKRGGGSSWLPGTYHPDTDTLYLGTSNPGSLYYGLDRVGDNLYTSTVLALEPKTGKIKWHRQEIPHDVWDFDAAYEIMHIKKNGKDLLVHLNKGGFVFVMDRKDGNLENVWQLSRNVTYVKNIDPKTGELIGRVEPQEGKDVLVCPSGMGGRSLNQGSYSPKTRLWYTNAFELCNSYAPEKQDPNKVPLPGGHWGATNMKIVPPPNEPASARLDARDPLTGKLKWSVAYPVPGLGAVLATGGGLVFNGDHAGVVHAYDDESGKELWSFNTGSGIRSSIVSYSVGGKQYILVPSGYTSHLPGYMAGVFPRVRESNGGAAMIAFTLE